MTNGTLVETTLEGKGLWSTREVLPGGSSVFGTDAGARTGPQVVSIGGVLPGAPTVSPGEVSFNSSK